MTIFNIRPDGNKALVTAENNNNTGGNGSLDSFPLEEFESKFEEIDNHIADSTEENPEYHVAPEEREWWNAIGGAWLPDVTPSGNLSWERSETKVPPNPTNIRGQDGDPGIILPLPINTELFAMGIDNRGHLVMHYAEGSTPPPLSVDSRGHLIWTI